MSYNVTELNSYREAKEDQALDVRMEDARIALGNLIENIDCDGTTLYFVWRNLNDILLGIDWGSDMLKSGLDFDIENYKLLKEEDEE